MIDKNNIYRQYMYNYPHKKSYGDIDFNLMDMASELETSSSNLYVHLPFCSTRCGYCNLFSLCGKNDQLMSSYVSSLEKEAKYISANLNLSINEFTIGGGTPLYLKLEELERVLALPNKYFKGNTKDIFITIETAPKETTDEKLALLKKYNVDRLSIGIQSFIDEELTSLNRNHKLSHINKALELIKKYNFPILNMDLIYGIENQSLESFKYSLDRLLEFKPDEVFLYPLYVRDNKNIKESGSSKLDFYNFGRDFLIRNGYTQNSMRKFSLKPGKVTTCGFSNSLSLGLGGRSYIGNLHFGSKYTDLQKNIKLDLEAYIIKKDFSKINHGFQLDNNEEKRLLIIKNLFTVNGLDCLAYKKVFNSQVLIDFPILANWIEEEYFILNKYKLVPTALGLSLSDYLGPKLISEKVQSKMDSWVDLYE